MLSKKAATSASQRPQNLRGVASPKKAARGRYSAVHEMEEIEKLVQDKEEYDDYEDDQSDDYDDEDYEVYYEDPEEVGKHWEEVQTAAGGIDEEVEPEAELQEAFAAGWRAKQKNRSASAQARLCCTKASR